MFRLLETSGGKREILWKMTTRNGEGGGIRDTVNSEKGEGDRESCLQLLDKIDSLLSDMSYALTQLAFL